MGEPMPQLGQMPPLPGWFSGVLSEEKPGHPAISWHLPMPLSVRELCALAKSPVPHEIMSGKDKCYGTPRVPDYTMPIG